VAGRVRIASATILGAVLLAGVGTAGASAGATTRPTSHVGAVAKNVGARISLRRTAHGKVLVGANGHSLYLFQADTRNKSNCGPACRKQWPPATTTGKPHAGPGVSASHLRVIKGHQVSYYGHPLYTYFNDKKVGQTTGEGKFKFGNFWYLLSAKGRLV
jgi:predicted lipoprotein with Yx(FWY)xxD motif